MSAEGPACATAAAAGGAAVGLRPGKSVLFSDGPGGGGSLTVTPKCCNTHAGHS